MKFVCGRKEQEFILSTLCALTALRPILLDKRKRTGQTVLNRRNKGKDI